MWAFRRSVEGVEIRCALGAGDENRMSAVSASTCKNPRRAFTVRIMPFHRRDSSGSLVRAEQLQKPRNNSIRRPYCRLRVFEREFPMTMKMVIVPLSLLSLAALLVSSQPHMSRVLMVLAKFAGHVSL